MKELVCNYAPVRFLPYRETGEFVNVGVVVYFPEIDYLDFELETRHTKRVRGFFPELEIEILKDAMVALARELHRRRESSAIGFPYGRRLDDKEAQTGLARFGELIRRRESLLHFGKPEMLITETPEQALGMLYQRFVERLFARSKLYQEVVMRNTLAKYLKTWNLRTEYKKDVKIGHGVFHVQMPFVHNVNERPDTAIKLLNLDQDETSAIFDHGDAWVQRMKRLKGRDCLPTHTIFALRLPDTGKRLDTAREISVALEATHIQTVRFDETEKLRALVDVKQRTA